MNDPLQTIFQPGDLKNTLFPASSRYYGIDLARLDVGEGKTVVYLRRRLVPAPEQFSLLEEHTVLQDERLDNITAKYFEDPQLFWRICDANGALHPEELTETINRRLRITLPEGIPGITDA